MKMGQASRLSRGIIHRTNSFNSVSGIPTMSQTFILDYWQDDGWYVGRLRGVPGVFSQGKDLKELEENIRDVYQLLLEDESAVPANSTATSIVIES